MTIDGLSILYLKSSSSEETGCNTILLEVAGSYGKILIPLDVYEFAGMKDVTLEDWLAEI